MCLKRVVALVLLALGLIMCLFLLPLKVWLALAGIILIVLAVIVYKTC